MLSAFKTEWWPFSKAYASSLSTGEVEKQLVDSDNCKALQESEQNTLFKGSMAILEKKNLKKRNLMQINSGAKGEKIVLEIILQCLLP